MHLASQSTPSSQIPTPHILFQFCSTLTSPQLFIWINTDNKNPAREFIPTLLSKKHINCVNTSTPNLSKVIRPLKPGHFYSSVQSSPHCMVMNTLQCNTNLQLFHSGQQLEFTPQHHRRTKHKVSTRPYRNKATAPYAIYKHINLLLEWPNLSICQHASLNGHNCLQ